MPQVKIELLDAPTIFHPGMTLRCRQQVDQFDEEATAVELSVMWFTEGKGTEDIGVHFFERWTDAENDLFEMREIETVLPNSPLSYDGTILKIRWCVRTRVFLAKGREVSCQENFRLAAKES